MGFEDVTKKDIMEIGTSWKVVKGEALNKLGCKRRVRSRVVLSWLTAAVSF